LTPADLIVVADDVALPWGMLRIREQGSAGGHNGLASVIGALDTQEFTRVRVGIKPERAVGDLAEYVLEPIPAALRDVAAEAVEQAAAAVEVILREGTRRAMARFNRRACLPRQATETESVA
jgi:PTH1 family peptidyl-tRNA hydrolase